MTATTPGPWISHGNAINTADDKRQIAAVIPHGIAHVMGDKSVVKELTSTDKADAWLLGAAPDLFEVVQRYVDSGDECIRGESKPATCACVACDLTRSARAALAKARGK